MEDSWARARVSGVPSSGSRGRNRWTLGIGRTMAVRPRIPQERIPQERIPEERSATNTSCLPTRPTRFIQGIFEETLHGPIGPMGNPLYSQEFYETDASRGFARGYTLIAERTFGPLAHAFGVPWGEEHHAAMKSRFPHAAGVTLLCDDLPEATNRVELDPEVTDSDGIPAARAVYTLSENSRNMLEHGAARAAEVLRAAGAVEVLDPGNSNMAHLLGTDRMGSDPDRSVVNAWI